VGWREHLEDYSAREEEEAARFFNRVCEGQLGPEEIYPPKDRLKLKKLYTHALPFGKRFLYQIPLYETTIIKLLPIDNKELFEECHGFMPESKEIDRLIDFAKETERVNFTLTAPPTKYERMEFLETTLFRAPSSSRVFPTLYIYCIMG